MERVRASWAPPATSTAMLAPATESGKARMQAAVGCVPTGPVIAAREAAATFNVAIATARSNARRVQAVCSSAPRATREMVAPSPSAVRPRSAPTDLPSPVTRHALNANLGHVALPPEFHNAVNAQALELSGARLTENSVSS